MKKILGTLLLLLSLSISTNAQTPHHLRCEHLSNPIGIDVENPRLSWALDDPRQDAVQKAYSIIVGMDSLSVLQSKNNQWTTSDEMLVSYKGKTLQPFTKYYWQVCVRDKDNVEHRSAVSTFETGMMGSNWEGAWISDGQDIHRMPAPYFRKVFETGKEIKSARAYIAVAGLYELYINGERIGNHRLDPLYTRFDRRNFYVSYDVTSQLQKGKNAIGVLLGNGWYNHQSMAVWDFHRAPWRNRPTFCMDLRITYTDGSVETIASERDWKTSSGSLILNSIYTAEHYDARLEQKGWNTVSFDDSNWHGAGYRAVPSQQVVSQQVVPIRHVTTIPAQKVTRLNDTTYVFDFAQNMSGVTRLNVSGESGTTIRLKHAERLYENGHVDMSNIDVYHRPVDNSDPFQTDIYTLAGNGTEEFMPKFNYKGFRYVEVISSKPLELNKESLTAYFTHSDVAQKGWLKASNPLIEKIWQATNKAYLSNLPGYPTDCPQREKNGWTGDAHFAIETALYNYDGITVYEKWLADHRDEQQPNGVLPDIIPTGGWGYGTDNGVDWTSTIAIIPWNIYLFYGDSKLLSDCYDNIKRYVDYIDRNAPEGLTSWGRGDWVPVKSRSSLELTSSVYFYVDTKILAQTAQLFGKEDDYKHYSQLADKIRNAINNKYLNRETGIYANGSQTELSVPLFWGVAPDDVKAKVVDNLVKNVEAAGFHLDVGVLGARAILSALSDNGQAEAAYKVAVQSTYPSWGWWVVNGATTLLENWDLQATRDISDNHMMFGDVGGWFFKGLGGIQPDLNRPGFKHIILKPNFVKGLNTFEAQHQSPAGMITSKWTRKGKTVIYDVEIPANSTATLFLSSGKKGETSMELAAGKHQIKVKD